MLDSVGRELALVSWLLGSGASSTHLLDSAMEKPPVTKMATDTSKTPKTTGR